MLTKRDFRLPEIPALSGNPAADVATLQKYFVELRKGMLSIVRALNDPDTLTITKAQLDTSPVGLNDPSTGAFTTLAASGLISANGGQVKFPATQNASADANTLDDYEEGTWTPVLTFATPGDLSVTYSVQVGDYTKIGRVVIASFRINTSAFTWTTGTGSVEITGLPFAASSDANFTWPGALTWGGVTKASYTNIVAEVAAGGAFANLTASGSGQAAALLQAADIPTGGSIRLRGQLIYRI